MSTHTLSYSNIVPAAAHCEFCDEFSGGTQNSFVTRYHDILADRFVFETHDFKIVPTLGQIVPGYLLLVPSEHYCALADLPIAQLGELEELKRTVDRRLHCTYGDYLLFEHGARNANSGGCGIYHAHLHAVPLSKTNDPVEQLKRAYPHDELSGLADLKHLNETASYLYYREVAGSQYVFYTEHLPSQYVRRLVAQAIGSDNWDWRRCSKEEAFLATLTQASAVLAPLSTPR